MSGYRKGSVRGDAVGIDDVPDKTLSSQQCCALRKPDAKCDPAGVGRACCLPPPFTMLPALEDRRARTSLRGLSSTPSNILRVLNGEEIHEGRVGEQRISPADIVYSILDRSVL